MGGSVASVPFVYPLLRYTAGLDVYARSHTRGQGWSFCDLFGPRGLRWWGGLRKLVRSGGSTDNLHRDLISSRDGTSNCWASSDGHCRCAAAYIALQLQSWLSFGSLPVRIRGESSARVGSDGDWVARGWPVRSFSAPKP